MTYKFVDPPGDSFRITFYDNTDNTLCVAIERDHKEFASPIKRIEYPVVDPCNISIDWEDNILYEEETLFELTDEQKTICEKVIGVYARLCHCDRKLKELAKEAFK